MGRWDIDEGEYTSKELSLIHQRLGKKFKKYDRLTKKAENLRAIVDLKEGDDDAWLDALDNYLPVASQEIFLCKNILFELQGIGNLSKDT